MQATVSGAEAGPFAIRHGFARTRVMRLQALDLTTADLPQPSVETVSLAEAGVESIRELYLAALADVPFPDLREILDEDFRRQVADSGAAAASRTPSRPPLPGTRASAACACS